MVASMAAIKTHCLKSEPPFSSSSCLSGTGLNPFQDSEKLTRVVTASAKGFSIGAGIKGGLALFSILARLRRTRLSSTRKTEVFSNRKAIDLAIKETLSYGIFLGTFAGTYVSVDEIIAYLGGHGRTAKWRSLLAGLIAGPSMLLTGPNTQHTSLAIYILMRAAVLASRYHYFWQSYHQMVNIDMHQSAYILKQDSLPPSYKSFLNKHGGKNLSILEDPEMKIPCTMIHGNHSSSRPPEKSSFSCQSLSLSHPSLSWIAKDHGTLLAIHLQPIRQTHSARSIITSKPILEPVCLCQNTFALVSNNRPCDIFGKGLLGTARSSLFLSVYCSSAWMWTCLLFRIFRWCNIPMVAIGAFPTGVALAIEKKSRRIEISLYCFARAVESFFTCTRDAGYLPESMNLKRADVVIFSISTAIIMHCYEQEREVFRSKYLNVLDWVFGVPRPPGDTSPRKDGLKAS
ncbi:hypothetical protein OIU76_007258 [Salix suchowensis]|nr:hypothetical protein OIU76_007258 [Salix suchowensis]